MLDSADGSIRDLDIWRLRWKLRLKMLCSRAIRRTSHKIRLLGMLVICITDLRLPFLATLDLRIRLGGMLYRRGRLHDTGAWISRCKRLRMLLLMVLQRMLQIMLLQVLRVMRVLLMRRHLPILPTHWLLKLRGGILLLRRIHLQSRYLLRMLRTRLRCNHWRCKCLSWSHARGASLRRERCCLKLGCISLLQVDVQGSIGLHLHGMTSRHYFILICSPESLGCALRFQIAMQLRERVSTAQYVVSSQLYHQVLWYRLQIRRWHVFLGRRRRKHAQIAHVEPCICHVWVLLLLLLQIVWNFPRFGKLPGTLIHCRQTLKNVESRES